MSRRFANLLCVWTCWATFLSSSTAHADVLEIQGSGPVWIAGGHSLAKAQEQEVADSNHDADGAQRYESSVTDVGNVMVSPAHLRNHLHSVSRKYDLSPALFEALVWQESRWNQRAISPAGARGLAQLMPATARDLGVNPANPLENLEGGARYLRMMLNKFGGNVELALAAYNAGPTRVERAGGIPNIRETREYVAAIMARLAQTVRR